MTSIHTNTVAMSTLAILRDISGSLSGTQESISSGLRVRDAKNNAAYWSIATTLRSDMASRSAVTDALNLSVAHVDTAYNGVTQSLDLVNQMKSRFVIAIDATDEDKLKLETEIVSLRNAFISVVKSSSFAGDNWLYKTSTTQSNTRSLVTGITRDAAGNVSLQKTTVDLTTVLLIDTSVNNSPLGILSRAYSSTSGFSAFAYTRHAYAKGGSGNVTAVATAGTPPLNAFNGIVASIRILDLVTQDLTSAAAQLGSIRSGLDIQKTFTEAMAGTEKRSLGRLVDADMNAESARAKALETRQQIVYQGLNIANSGASTLLQLFL